MTSRGIRVLAWCAMWLGMAGAVADEGALAALRQGKEVSCQSPEPFFCENVHVRCAGRTTVRTFAFTLRPAAGSVALVSEATEFQRRYASAAVEWDKDGTYVLLQPKGAPGYVKLLADGNYVFRHYVQSRGVMSLGRCE